jgi:hypothetical protein
MIRFMHLAAIASLVASAGYVYSVKYETLYYAEKLAELKAAVQKERDAVAVLKAEWHHLNRPDRLQAAVERHLDLQPLAMHQLARLSDVPSRPPRADEIGRKLEALAVEGTTPKDGRPGDGRTATTRTPTR